MPLPLTHRKKVKDNFTSANFISSLPSKVQKKLEGSRGRTAGMNEARKHSMIHEVIEEICGRKMNGASTPMNIHTDVGSSKQRKDTIRNTILIF